MTILEEKHEFERAQAEEERRRLDNQKDDYTSLYWNPGAKYLGFFLLSFSHMREKYISFAQLVYFLREVCLLSIFE